MGNSFYFRTNLTCLSSLAPILLYNSNALGLEDLPITYLIPDCFILWWKVVKMMIFIAVETGQSGWTPPKLEQDAVPAGYELKSNILASSFPTHSSSLKIGMRSLGSSFFWMSMQSITSQCSRQLQTLPAKTQTRLSSQFSPNCSLYFFCDETCQLTILPKKPRSSSRSSYSALHTSFLNMNPSVMATLTSSIKSSVSSQHPSGKSLIFFAPCIWNTQQNYILQC